MARNGKRKVGLGPPVTNKADPAAKKICKPEVNLNKSPPGGQSLIQYVSGIEDNFLERILEAGQQQHEQAFSNPDDRMAAFESNQRLLIEMFRGQNKKLAYVQDAVSEKCEHWKAKCVKLERQVLELQTELAEFRLYSRLFTTRELVAFNLLDKNLWEKLDSLIEPAINNIAQGITYKAERKMYRRMFQQYTGEDRKGYKTLLGAEDHGASAGLLKVVEDQVLEEMKSKVGASSIKSEDLRSVMKMIMRLRVAGAQPFEEDGLDNEERKEVLRNIKAAIPGKGFEAKELRNEKVLKVLEMVCKIEEQNLE